MPNATAAAAETTTIAAGDLVFVRPAYDMLTKANTSVDAWADTYMLVVRAGSNGDCLLDYDEAGEGEVYINASRLARIP